MVVRLFVWVLGGVWDPIHEGGNMQNAIFVTVIMLTGRKTPWTKLSAGYILAGRGTYGIDLRVANLRWANAVINAFLYRFGLQCLHVWHIPHHEPLQK